MPVSDRSRKLFAILVAAGSAAVPFAASCSSTGPDPKIDAGRNNGPDGFELAESSAQDTGTGAEFW